MYLSFQVTDANMTNSRNKTSNMRYWLPYYCQRKALNLRLDGIFVLILILVDISLK